MFRPSRLETLRLVAPQAVGSRPLTFFSRTTSTSSATRLPKGGGAAARHLVASVVGFLEDVSGYISATYTERYSRRQTHGSEHDQERGRRKLYRYPQLRDRREDRVDDDRVLGDARQDVKSYYSAQAAWPIVENLAPGSTERGFSPAVARMCRAVRRASP